MNCMLMRWFNFSLWHKNGTTEYWFCVKEHPPGVCDSVCNYVQSINTRVFMYEEIWSSSYIFALPYNTNKMGNKARWLIWEADIKPTTQAWILQSNDQIKNPISCFAFDKHTCKSRCIVKCITITLEYFPFYAFDFILELIIRDNYFLFDCQLNLNKIWHSNADEAILYEYM